MDHRVLFIATELLVVGWAHSCVCSDGNGCRIDRRVSGSFGGIHAISRDHGRLRRDRLGVDNRQFLWAR